MTANTTGAGDGAARIGSARLYATPRQVAGQPPGTLVGAPDAETTVINVTVYGNDHLAEHPACGVEDIATHRGHAPRLWLDVTGLADIAAIQRIGDIFGLHPLALEDVVHVRQRAKVEEFDDHLFIVARIVDAPDTQRLEQFSMFVGRDFLITFQEHAGDFFQSVRERLRQGRGRTRNGGPDYLAYALLDAAIDGFYPVLEALGENLETLEDAVISEPAPSQIDALHKIKRELLDLRRALWPARDMLSALSRNDAAWIADSTRLYLRDCHDHAIQLIDIIETYREISSGLLDVYLSSQSARLNEVMKVLTIISTIFMPLSFIAGVYGMNFDTEVSVWNMPELHWRLGYPIVLGLMSAVAAVLMVFFWRRGWLGGGRGRR